MQPHLYRFGEYSIDLSDRQLRRREELITLPAYAFDCLVYLIEHRTRVVGRDELIASVWGRIDVTDDQLGHIIRRARRAIGERGDGQGGAIRTVPRVGFRWVHEVSVDDRNTVSPSEFTVTPSPLQPDGIVRPPDRSWPRWRRPASWVAFGCGLVLAAGGYFLYGPPNGAARTSARSTSAHQTTDAVAVLPVAVSETVPDGTWMRLGLMDFVAGRFKGGGVLTVPSDDVVAIVRNASDVETAAGTVGKLTNVRYVLLSTIAPADPGWVAHLELRDKNGSMRMAQARAESAIEAVRDATDELLSRLGLPDAGQTGASASGASDTELLQRAEAALLANRYDESRQLLELAPADLRDSPEVQLRLARLDYKIGRLDVSRDRYLAILEKTPAETAPQLRARALNGLGAVTNDLGQVGQAEQYLSQAIDLLSDLSDPAELGRAYFRRGNALLTRGHYAETLADWGKARIAFSKAGDARALASADLNEASLYILLYRPAEAIPLLQRAGNQLESFGVLEEVAMARSNEMEAHFNLLQPVSALNVATAAGTQFDKLKSPFWRHIFEVQRARALSENGRLNEARIQLDRLAGEIAPAETGLLAVVWGAQAEVGLREGSFETAASLAQKALTALPASQGMDQWARTRLSAWLVAVRALRGAQRNAEAAAELRNLLAWSEATGDLAIEIQALVAEAEQAWSEDRREAAFRIYDDVMKALPRNAGTPSHAANAIVSYGNALIDAGSLDVAAAVAGQISRGAEQNFDCAVLQARLYRALRMQDAWRSAMSHAKSLAGEREMPAALLSPPG